MSLSEFLNTSGGMDAVTQSQRLPFIQAGNFDLEVNRCVSGKSRAGAAYFVAELKILASDNATLPVGANVSMFISFATHIDVRKRNLLEFVCGAGSTAGISAEDAKTAIVTDKITGDEQILAGEKFHLRAYETVSTKTGTKYLAFQYSPYKAP